MQYVRQAGSDPRFLRKALNEASGELQQQFYGIPRPLLLEPGAGDDEDWCLLAIAYHLKTVEEGFLGQLEAMFSAVHPEIAHIDLDDIPLREDYEHLDEDRVLEEFHFYRRHSSYMLWELGDAGWERTALHPYRGEVSVTHLAREMYRHDLEHLWQARRMIEALAAR